MEQDYDDDYGGEESEDFLYCYYVSYVASLPERDRFGACLYYFENEIEGEKDLMEIQADIYSKVKIKDDTLENVVILTIMNLGLRPKPSAS
jgi:hypothetical protein